jgi:hypothetical protein
MHDKDTRKTRGYQGGILFGEEAKACAWAQSACSTSALLACSLGAPPKTKGVQLEISIVLNATTESWKRERVRVRVRVCVCVKENESKRETERDLTHQNSIALYSQPPHGRAMHIPESMTQMTSGMVRLLSAMLVARTIFFLS